LFFKLITEEGPRTAVSVVLLIPIFGTIFGAMFLDEVVTINKIIGCATILMSMKFILNLSKQNFFKSKTPPAV
jgi:drug/metabolite transporter (DMT)-like permease